MHNNEGAKLVPKNQSLRQKIKARAKKSIVHDFNEV